MKTLLAVLLAALAPVAGFAQGVSLRATNGVGWNSLTLNGSQPGVFFTNGALAHVLTFSNLNFNINGVAGVPILQVGQSIATTFRVADAGGSFIYNNGIGTFSGNLNINGAGYSWPGANAGGTLQNDGLGNLSWSPVQGVTIPNTITPTNFVLNTVYTNNSASVQLLDATVALITTGVSGNASLDLMADQSGGTNFKLQDRVGINTLITSLAQNYTNNIAGAVSNGATYYFTNSSVGAGDSAAIVPGTGEAITLSDGAAANVATLVGGKVPTSQLGSGVASSTTYLAGDQTYKTLAGAVAAVGSYPLAYDNNHALNKQVCFVGCDNAGNAVIRIPFPVNAVASGNSPSVVAATATTPEGGKQTIVGPGNCGFTENAGFCFSTKDYTLSFAFQPTAFTAGRWWCALDGTGLLATVDVPNNTVGFRFSTVTADAHWIAYSAAATSGTNQVDTGVSFAVNTSYVLTMQKAGTTCTFYINGTLVSTQTFTPTGSNSGVWHKVQETDGNTGSFTLFQDTFEIGLY